MIEFRLLGSVDLKGPEGTLRSVLAQPKRVALLAYLAVAKPKVPGVLARTRYEYT